LPPADALSPEHAHLLILHPPYRDIIRFSEDKAHLSNAGDLESFLDGSESVAQHGFSLLEPGRIAALMIGHKHTEGMLTPLGFYCMERMQRLGFRSKAIIVKNIEGNGRGKGRSSNLWCYRALRGGFYIFKREYVMVFRKPES